MTTKHKIIFTHWVIVFVTFHCLTFEVSAQSLERKALLGVLVKEKNNALLVDSVFPNSTFEKLAIQKGDILRKVNNREVKTTQQFTQIASFIYGGEELDLEYIHEGQIKKGKAQTIPKPYFNPDWCTVSYESVKTVKGILRTIVYTPKKLQQAPAIFFIPGYNCGSIENFPNNYNGKMIEAWVKQGYVVYTIEKSGVGDSYGCKPCQEVDLQTDIEIYKAGFARFKSLPYVDTNHLFIWGHSMGGIIAPLVAQNETVKGIMVFGTVFRPWSEFLLEMHRVQKPLLDSLNYEETESFVRSIQKIYYEFFVLKKSPAQLNRVPAYKKLVETELEYTKGKEDMWGRHWRFWQQLDSINLAKAWQTLSCKVLVLHGAADYIQCSSVEPYLIAETVNKVHPGNAKAITVQGIDHLMMNSKDYTEAVKNFNERAYLKGNFNTQLVDETLQWMGLLKD